jgi:hypothetical protein
LKKHPEIYLELKEHHFWDRRDRPLQEYLDEFKDKGSRKAGDITPAYELLASRTIQWIKRLNSNIKMIYIIRNPIEKAWSGCFRAIQVHYPQRKKVGSTEGWYHSFLQRQVERNICDYKTRIENWRAVFGWDQFLLLLHDFVKERPNQVLRRTVRHIGVSDINFYENMDVSAYVPSSGTGFPGKRAWTTKVLPQFLLDRAELGNDLNRTPPLPEFLKPILVELHRQSIEELGQYLRLDLSHWLAT